MARKTAGPNPDRDRFIAECARDYAKHYVVRPFDELPTPETVQKLADKAGAWYDLMVAPFAQAQPAPEPAEIGKR